MNSILSALAGNFSDSGPPVLEQPRNVGELILALAALPEGRWSYARAHEATSQLYQDAQLSAAATRQLVVGNPALCAEYRGLLARLTGAYQKGALALEQLLGELREETVGPSVEALQAAQLAARDAYLALSQEVLRCPLCAAQTEVCQACGLEALYPDLRAFPAPDLEALTPGLLTVFQAVRRVETGQASLATLAPILEAFAAELEEGFERASQQPESERRNQLLAHAEGMWAGLGQMQSVFDSRQTSDLREGWSRLYGHHCEILELFYLSG